MRLCTFFKIKTNGKPEYLFNLIPAGQHSYKTRSLNQIETYYCRTDIKTLLFGDQNYTQVENAYIINPTIKYLVDSERFNGPLL